MTKKIDFQSDLFYTTNPSFTLTNHIIEFTRPLKKLDIDYFTFDRHYADGTRIALSNSVDWIIHYWRQELFKAAIFEHAPISFSTGHVFWNWLKWEPIYSAAAAFGINNGMTLIEQRGDYCDFFHFGSIHHNRLNNERLNEYQPTLRQFCSLFKHKLRTLIEQVVDDRIVIPDYRPPVIPTGKVDSVLLMTDWQQLLERRDISRIYLGEEYGNRYLTRKEFSLLREFTMGNSGTEVAERLCISSDAVNKHVRNIKERLGCKSLCQLGFMMGRLSARNIFPFPINPEK